MKRYADLCGTVQDALQRYAADVRNSTFPDDRTRTEFPPKSWRGLSRKSANREPQDFTKALRKRDYFGLPRVAVLG